MTRMDQGGQGWKGDRHGWERKNQRCSWIDRTDSMNIEQVGKNDWRDVKVGRRGKMVRKGLIEREGRIEKADRTDKTNRAKIPGGKWKGRMTVRQKRKNE